MSNFDALFYMCYHHRRGGEFMGVPKTFHPFHLLWKGNRIVRGKKEYMDGEQDFLAINKEAAWGIHDTIVRCLAADGVRGIRTTLRGRNGRVLSEKAHAAKRAFGNSHHRTRR